jgi:hemolysin D
VQPETDFLPAALEIQERPPSPLGRALSATIMLFFTLAAVWAYSSKIDIVAIAHGRIIPSGRVKTIQPFEIGIVKRIHVEEGQLVSAGDPLIDLDATATRTDLAQLDEQLVAARLDYARHLQLSRIVDQAETNQVQNNLFQLDLDPNLRDVTDERTRQLQLDLLKTQWREYRARVAALGNAIKSRIADLAATKEQIKKLEKTVPLIGRRANALKLMADKKLGSEQSWLELEEQRLTQEHDLAALRNQAVRIGSSISEARKQGEVLSYEFRREILGRLAESERHIEQLEHQRIKALQRTELQKIAAPVNGVIHQLAVHTLGGVVSPAQELMKIVPRDEAIVVEAWILNKDIGFVEAGQPAEIKIETFPFTKYGTIEGTIIMISDDATSDPEHGLIYAARVGMAKSTLRVGKRLVKMTPGMAVTVEIKTGSRRLIEYLTSPLLRYRNESFGER